MNNAKAIARRLSENGEMIHFKVNRNPRAEKTRDWREKEYPSYPKDKGNGRLERRGWHGNIWGKSSRPMMREQAQWMLDACEELNPTLPDRYDAPMWARGYDWDYEFFMFEYAPTEEVIEIMKTHEGQMMMEDYYLLLDWYERIWWSVCEYNHEVGDDTVPVGRWRWSREFMQEIKLLEGSEFINEAGHVVAKIPRHFEDAPEDLWAIKLNLDAMGLALLR